MNIAAQDIETHLQQQLSSIYLLGGDEPLQLMEAADAIIAKARAMGYHSRETLHVERNFDWDEFKFAATSMSLFSEKRVLELRMPKLLLGRNGGDALIEYCQQPDPDAILLIHTAKLERSSKASKWFKTISAQGVLVESKQLRAYELPNWIAKRAAKLNLQLDHEAQQLLVQRVEGNMLACAQELQKLALQQTGSQVVNIDAGLIRQQVLSSSRYSVYDLLDAALAGGRENLCRALQILASLKAEGVATVLITAALVAELRNVYKMSLAREQGQAESSYLAGVWQSRKRLLAGAVRRLSTAKCRELIQLLALLDKVNKGVHAGDSWQLLAQISEKIAGLELAMAVE